MFTKILIANRGEIACRIIKTAHRLGVLTVAVYSDADAKSLHVELADEAIHIGPSPAIKSYLVAEKVVQAAIKTGAQAIHPGYGFLSENTEFCALCEKHNITFIGPPAKAIASMGSKSAAKTIMDKAGVPLVPGYHGDDQRPDVLQKAADDMGYPVLLKAVAGGGGRGMRPVFESADFSSALVEAKREALSSFANDDMLIEKYLPCPRHVEVQVFCDTHGHGVYLFDRDCSVQRRHQKIIEEAPAPDLPDEFRKMMGDAAVHAAQAIDYVGAGTVEFLVEKDAEGQWQFYFMEMNTRLQVEHPITEMISGQDLVEWQLRVAAGEALPLKQEQLKVTGHAFEARIYAEDPAQNFCPSTGTLQYLHMPSESSYVRVDTGVRQGDEISSYYDPMISKLVVWDEDREYARKRMMQALAYYYIAGVTTNIPLLGRVLSCPAFVAVDFDNNFIEKHNDYLFSDVSKPTETKAALAIFYLLLQRKQKNNHQFANDSDAILWESYDAWRMNQEHAQKIVVTVEGVEYTALAKKINANNYTLFINDYTCSVSGVLVNNALSVEMDGHRIHLTGVDLGSDQYALFFGGINAAFADLAFTAIEFKKVQPEMDMVHSNTVDTHAKNSCCAPMNGRILEVYVEQGQEVASDDALIVMEAMKMEHTIRAPYAGTISSLNCVPDAWVSGGDALLELSAVESKS